MRTIRICPTGTTTFQSPSSSLGERTAAALQAKKARGERVGGVPFGWRLAADRRTLEVEPREAFVISLVKQLRKDGLSIRAIVHELKRRGDVVGRTGRPLQVAAVHALAVSITVTETSS